MPSDPPPQLGIENIAIVPPVPPPQAVAGTGNETAYQVAISEYSRGCHVAPSVVYCAAPPAPTAMQLRVSAQESA